MTTWTAPKGAVLKHLYTLHKIAGENLDANNAKFAKKFIIPLIFCAII